MAQPILAIDHINGPQVYRLNFADPTTGAIGGPIPIGATITGTWTPNNYQTNFVIRHGYKIYAYHRIRLWVYDEENPSAGWVQFYQFPEGFFGGHQCMAGLHKMLLDGDPHLVALGTGTAATNRLSHVSWNLRTNTLRADGVGAQAGLRLDNQGFHDAHPWKQFLFFFDSDPNDPKKFDFNINAMSGIAVATSSGLNSVNDGCLFVPWNGKLYMLHESGARWRLWEYREGLNIFEAVAVFPYALTQLGAQNVRGTAWQQNGFLYTILPTHNLSGGNGWTMWRISQGTNITLDDISTSLPVNLRMPYIGSTEPPGWNSNQRWTAAVDQESNPTNPVATIYLHQDGTTTTGQLEAFSWVDPTLTSIDTGTAANFITSKEIDGGGSRFWTAGDVVPEVTSAEPIGGDNVLVRFKLHGGGVQSLGVWWALEHDFPTTRGSLTNPSAGSITGGDTMSGITADGTTEYSVEWRAQFDGITDLDDVNLIIKPD